MSITRIKSKRLRESNKQSTGLTREKTSILKRNARSKGIVKSSKSALGANLKSVVITHLRRQRNSAKKNDADKTKSKRLEGTRTHKTKNAVKNIKGAQKVVSNASASKTRLQHDALTHRLRSGVKRKHTKSNIENKFSKTKLKVDENIPLTKKQKHLKTLETKNMNEKSKDSCEKDLSKQHILQCINAIFHLTQEKLENKTDVQQLFSGESQPIFMQVTCVRIPKVPRRQMRMILPHSIITPDDDIALFVCDLERGRRKDYEPSKEHYENLLRTQGFTRAITVIPMTQVKTEYDQFELKRKLAASYDHFFVDGRISGHITHLLGSEFLKRRKVPVSIRMNSKDLKHEMEWAMRKTAMRMHSHGDTHIVQVANTSMSKEDILENILAACKNIATSYPGHWENVRSVQIKTPLSLAIPIYITLKNKNTVPIPVIKAKRPKAYHTVEGELTTLEGDARVTVTPEGDVILTQTKLKKLGKKQSNRKT